ncbi:MAG: hypothetical protein Aurels2KO_40520 [Aureliella sp.]
MYRIVCLLGLVASCLCFAGCSTQGVASSDIEGAQAAFDAAKPMMESGDYASALPLLTQALDEVGLDPDQATTAMLYRSICHSTAGNTEAAEADIAEAEMGGPSEGLLVFAKAHAAEASGNSAEATKLFKSARRLDSSLKKK